MLVKSQNYLLTTFPVNIVTINTMSYRINQKIGNNVYVYEVESYWDPEKKQPRQKRKYIGKKDPVTGEVSTPRKGFTPRMARDYGHIYLLEHMSVDFNNVKKGLRCLCMHYLVIKNCGF